MERIRKLLEKLEREKLDGIFLKTNANVRYISGFTGSDSFILITKNENYFITDGRYTEQAEEQCPNFTLLDWRKPFPRLSEVITEIINKQNIKRLGFEREYVTYDMYEMLAKDIPSVEFVPTKGIVESLRYTKEKDEIEYIRKAAEISDKAFAKILDFIKPGMTEKEVAIELEYYLKKNGADAPGFETILLAGERTSLLHGQPSDRKIEYGDFILMDFGALYEGYISDMSRVIVVGKASEEQRQIYNVIKKAQEEALKGIKAGNLGKIPDDYVRKVMEEHGYINQYYPGLGHGVGLVVHEEPFMRNNCERILEENCVLAVEPGVYIPKWGGVRIEDTVLVTKEGYEILTKSPKDLIVI